MAPEYLICKQLQSIQALLNIKLLEYIELGSLDNNHIYNGLMMFILVCITVTTFAKNLLYSYTAILNLNLHPHWNELYKISYADKYD